MRKLTLRKETIAELGTSELASVVGGIPPITKSQCVSGIVACPTNYDCLTYDACFTTHGCA